MTWHILKVLLLIRIYAEQNFKNSQIENIAIELLLWLCKKCLWQLNLLLAKKLITYTRY